VLLGARPIRVCSEASVECVAYLVEVDRQQVDGLASRYHEARLFDEDRGARREPRRVEPFSEEVKGFEEVDAHRRLRGCGASKLTEREADQVIAVGLLGSRTGPDG
jgi:hypothetical protein